MRYILSNGLYIRIQYRYISYAVKRKALKIENVFLVNEWEPIDMPFDLYTEVEPRKIQKSFHHPEINATEDILRGANGAIIGTETRNAIMKIK